VAEQCTALNDISAAAKAYVRRWFPDRAPLLVQLSARLDQTYCRDVAEYYDRAPRFAPDARLKQLYDLLKQENLKQYRAVLDADIKVVPWTKKGQPYYGFGHLVKQVCATRKLYVYLTRIGHGPARSIGYHPLRTQAGISASGIELCHNDVFRVVHDVFGHILFGKSFGLRGEFEAAYGHLGMYPEDLLPVLFTEQIGQICWFFCGPHLADRAGRLRSPGDPAYLSPAERPYPEQKVFLFPQRFVDEFAASFVRSRDDDLTAVEQRGVHEI
jgi:hypothetical protein